MFIWRCLNSCPSGNVTSVEVVVDRTTKWLEGEMANRTNSATRLRPARTDASLQLWTAPPRNHDWIAARIGRG
jgi:hypothetical protein